MRWPAAQVTAIDFSATSVRLTEALRRQHNLRNLRVHQLSIERVRELGATFDQIVCTGVLHHLADPDVGLAALREVLAPGGAMHLMVYAPYGRAGIYMLQELCRRIGVRPDGDAIPDLVTALGSLPPEHPAAALLRCAPDFRDAAGLADALLHPQDRAYSVPELFDFLERGGLRFGRWVRQAPYDPGCGAMARIPQRATMARLPPRDRYAAAELFRGAMVRHSAIVRRSDDGGEWTRIEVDGASRPGDVPIRAPDTICVDEGVPEGAAAVLINRSHTFRDLYLPIDDAEKRMFDAIDGQRCIADIAPLGGSVERAGAFFERLYAHDQIVFDSQARP
jgi:SAM-dependent methyltransferase